jgi:hypothetical protein
MKKTAVFLMLISISVTVFSQRKLKSIDTLDLNKITPLEVSKKFKNGFDVKVIVLKDGALLKKGSNLIAGTPSNSMNVNNNVYNGAKVSQTSIDFTYLMINKYSLMSALSAVYFGNTFSKTEIVVERIRVYRTKKTIQAIIDFTKKDGTNTGIGKFGSIINLELAISKGEIINPNSPMTRAEAITKLKESKDLLELDMMTLKEYEKIKNELTPIIRGEN